MEQGRGGVWRNHLQADGLDTLTAQRKKHRASTRDPAPHYNTQKGSGGSAHRLRGFHPQGPEAPPTGLGSLGERLRELLLHSDYSSVSSRQEHCPPEGAVLQLWTLSSSGRCPHSVHSWKTALRHSLSLL
uniref:Uncharacterized protein n=1 Tax=Knipowitschia caucasica TaxID=637954 RepID=A0AAV2KKZ9_KNICA